MKRQLVKTFLFLTIILLGVILMFPQPVDAGFRFQLPTGSIPTVTGTPLGVVITVKPDQEQINVRSGPGTAYPKVGVLLTGQTVPAKGRSVGGDWIMIVYPGVQWGVAWVYAPLVNVPAGAELPVAEPPPTPTPLVTPTIDPTLAAQFIVTQLPTRLPTYTPPADLVIPTFLPQTGAASQAGVPMGLVVVILFVIGILLGAFTLTQR
jgi:hypothetical protein